MMFEDDCNDCGCIVRNYSFNQHYTLWMKRREVVFYDDLKHNFHVDPKHDHQGRYKWKILVGEIGS